MTADGITVRLLDADAGLQLEWPIESVVTGPDGQYVGVDGDGRPRIILTGDELARLTSRGVV